jgi:hypothetical protein
VIFKYLANFIVHYSLFVDKRENLNIAKRANIAQIIHKKGIADSSIAIFLVILQQYHISSHIVRIILTIKTISLTTP